MGFLKKDENCITYKPLLSPEDDHENWEEVDDEDPEILRLLGGELDPYEKKMKELKALRDTKEMGGFLYLGKVFDSDEKACIRISLASQNAKNAIDLGVDFPVIDWTCKDNTSIELDAKLFLGLSAALTEHSARTHGIYNHLKGLVFSATSKEEIENINWPEDEM